MKITKIKTFQVDLPLAEGGYKMSGGKEVGALDSTIVAVETDAGITGYGEVCPLGANYLPSYPAGARIGIAQIAPALIGEDPRGLDALNARMDQALAGHPYAKSPLDVACWDILGQASGMPVCQLLGGGKPDAGVPLYRPVSQAAPETMAARMQAYQQDGYCRFQLKVGGEVDEDIARIRAANAVRRPGDILVADANCGWTLHQAMRLVRAVQDIDVYIEQPCRTYQENLSVRRQTGHPFVLDETIQSVDALLQAQADGAMDVINLKISKVGGLTRARLIRDLCVNFGIVMTIEDTWGSDVATAAIAHLAQSTPAAFRFSSADFNHFLTVATAEGAPVRDNGFMKPSSRPGLGIRIRPEVLGTPVSEIGGM